MGRPRIALFFANREERPRITRIGGIPSPQHHGAPMTNRRIKPTARQLITAGLAALFVASGCMTVSGRRNWDPAKHSQPEKRMLLIPGDELEITFLGAPELSTTQRIRRDGRISLHILGEFHASGKTAGLLKEELVVLYSPHLQIKEATVIVRSSAHVFVSGAVLASGRIEMKRPLTALEAIMEAGGFNTVIADVRRVVVIRQTEDKRMEFALDLAAALSGEGTPPFYLKPNDIVHVPQKKHWL